VGAHGAGDAGNFAGGLLSVDGLKLLLGCGEDDRPGWVHVDRVALPHVNVIHDLDVYPWPFADNAVEYIEALDVLEHLNDTVAFMDECWRILSPSGTLYVQAVGWQSENLWRDPTHKRGFHPETFAYFDPDSPWCQQYGHLYTRRTWKVLYSELQFDNVVAKMQPRKGP
jgi:SAM-dependent methyltransferase